MTMACSQVHRAVVRWLGGTVESRECGADLTDVVEMVPLGHGGLLARHRYTAPDERWDLAADGTVQRTMFIVSYTDWTYAGFTLLPPYGQAAPSWLAAPPPPLLVYQPRSSNWSLARDSADGVKAEYTGTWPDLPGAPPPWNSQELSGRQLIGLSDDLALDRYFGDGSVRLWRFVRTADGLRSATSLSGLVGPARDAFRRGHRLVPLGPGRLLEWLPVPCADAATAARAAACARFNIWSYSTAAEAQPGPVDPIAASPVSTGSWADVGEGEEILSDEAHVFVWTRASGGLRVYHLNGAAADPLDQSLLVGPPQAVPGLASLDWQAPTRSAPLQHLLVILQDGHSFDGYFGRYCQGAAGPGGAPPACEEGAACCEGLPPEKAELCVPLDPTAVRAYQPNSSPPCMRAKMNGGLMDAFGVAHGDGCGDPADVACAGIGAAAGAIGAYHELAARGALADRFFQSYAFVERDGDPDGKGPSASTADPAVHNFLYLTAARFDDPYSFVGTPQVEQELARMEVNWAVYAGPTARALLRAFRVPPSHDQTFYPYRALEGGELESDLDLGQLPSVAVVLPTGDDPQRSEAAGQPLDRPIGFVTDLINRVEASPLYRDNTLVLLAYLTAGGTYDHVAPPPPPPLWVDATPPPAAPRAIYYGPRVPLLALGRLARRGHVSHVQMELSSVTAFIEWNWLSSRAVKDIRAMTDPRAYRDASANGIGSLLDPALGIPAGPP